MQHAVLSGIRPSFPGLSQSAGQITHVLLTRSPLESPQRALSVRLACVKHAASVRPEPGSNSPNKTQSEKPDQNTPHPQHGDARSAAKKQKTKTTKHTIEFSNNTPDRPPNQRAALGRGQIVRTARTPPKRCFPQGGRRALRTDRVATTSTSYVRENWESNYLLGGRFRPPVRPNAAGPRDIPDSARRQPPRSTRSTPAIFRFPRRSTSQRP